MTWGSRIRIFSMMTNAQDFRLEGCGHESRGVSIDAGLPGRKINGPLQPINK
jgi:hypothetical protein